MSLVKKYENIEEMRSEEETILFHLNNQKKIGFKCDRRTFADALQRLKSRIGVIKIGDDKENRVDLNQVTRIEVNGKPY